MCLLILICKIVQITLSSLFTFRINPADKLNSVRIILPDIISFVVSLLVLIACRLLLKPRESSTSLTENADETIRARLFRTGVIIADFLGNFLVIALTGLCGITTPSILNSIYFLAFLIVATVWSCGVRLSFWFSVYRFLILIYCGLHLVATYLNQFEFMADVWVDSFQNNTLVERWEHISVCKFDLTLVIDLNVVIKCLSLCCCLYQTTWSKSEMWYWWLKEIVIERGPLKTFADLNFFV